MVNIQALTVHVCLVFYLRHKWLRVGEDAVHGAGRVCEDHLIVVLRYHILLACHCSRVCLEELQEVIDGHLCVRGEWEGVVSSYQNHKISQFSTSRRNAPFYALVLIYIKLLSWHI